MTPVVLDTSALAKLVVWEPQSDALRAWLRDRPIRACASALVRTELLRAVRRAAPDRLGLARQVLASLYLLPITAPLLDDAAELGAPVLRTLDAIHLASVRLLAADGAVLVTYDARMAEAALALGLTVAAPRPTDPHHP